eukprot:Sspe_Gene.57544::Locus_31570_Transcript_6_8_Confidence_0.667_Length_762::g.57544::m.57544
MLRQVSIPDLHQFAVSAVLDSSATNPYSPNTVDGSLRKVRVGVPHKSPAADGRRVPPPSPCSNFSHASADDTARTLRWARRTAGCGVLQAVSHPRGRGAACGRWMPVAVYFGILSAATEAGGFEGLRSVKTVLTGAPGRREEPR